MEKSKPTGAFRAITLLILGMGIVLCSLSFVLAEFQFQRDLESRTKEVNSQNLNQALALEQNLNRSFAQADAILQLVKTEMETDGSLNTAYVGLLKDFLKPGIFNQIGVADSRGNLIYSAVPLMAPINISDREHFLTHINADSGNMFIAAPRVNRVAGTSSIFLTRRLNDAGGNFAGIVIVGIAPDYFSNVFQQLHLGTDNSFVLLKTDGAFLVRIPDVDSAEIMASFKTDPVLAKVNQGVSFGIYESPGAGDGVARVGAFQRLANYPAVVLVAISKNDAFRVITERGLNYRHWAGLFSLLLSAILLLLWWQVRKQYQTKEALREANANLEHKVKDRTRELDTANESLTAQNEEITVQNEELIAQNEEITAMNEEIATLNQNLTGMNDMLEHRVAERTVELTDAHQELTAQYEELEQTQETLRRSSEIQTVLREIAEASVLASSLDELYRSVHRLVGRVLPAKAFVINFLDEVAGEIVVPYHSDDASFLLEPRRPIDKGMTEYVLRMGRAVHVTPAEMNRLSETGEYTLTKVLNAKLCHYLGAPLIDSKGKPFGVVALALMDDVQSFQPKDVEVLSIIAAQVSQAIERKQAEEKLVESEGRYRAVIEQAPEAVLICDPDTGEVIEVNSRFTERLGYDLQKDGTLNLFELIVDEPEKIRSYLDRGKQTGSVPLQRRLFNHRNGSVVSVERSATLVRYRGRSLFVMTLRDVSDEVRREQEIQRDAQLATRVQNALLSVPEPSDYLDIDTVYQPFGYVDGDLYFMDWRYDGSLLRGFLIDATGHGLGTALHTAALHVLLREVNEFDLPLSDAMRWLNRRAGEYFDEGTFAGAQGFELDLQTRQLRWVCAGIPKTWVATKTQQGVVECPGMCLGIREDETFDTHTMSVDVGDSLYFMTDGLADLLGRRTGLPLDRYPEMVELLRTLSESEDRRDDATAVCIHVCSLPQSLVRQDGWPRNLRFNGYGDYQRLKGEVAKILAEVTGKPHSFHEVAVHEALANAMECRDGVPRQHKARLRFNKVGNRLIVRVKTSRMGFAGNAILRRLRSHPEDMFSFGEDASMGRGIPMMLSMSHRMTYNSEGTELLLAWKLDE